jgi:hypothetical protein
LLKKKTTKLLDSNVVSTKDIHNFMQGQAVATGELEQAMYIQIEQQQVDAKKVNSRMRLVRHKPDRLSMSPRPRKRAINEGQISDVSDVEPDPKTGFNMLKLNLRFDTLEDILERLQN